MEVIELMRHHGQRLTPQHLSMLLEGAMLHAADAHTVATVVRRFESVHGVRVGPAELNTLLKVSVYACV
jgi:hypothetical protein